MYPSGEPYLPRRKCRVANIFWNNYFDWRHHKTWFWLLWPPHTSQIVQFPLTAAYQPPRQPANQPAHLTSWPITTFKIYKENAGMSNPGLRREAFPASFLNTLPCKSQTLVVLLVCLFFVFFESQGKPDRVHVSESSPPSREPELWYFNSLSQPLPWEHIIMWSLVMGKPHWVSRFESVPEVESSSLLMIPNRPHFLSFYVYVCLLYLVLSYGPGLDLQPFTYFSPQKEKREWDEAGSVSSLNVSHLASIPSPSVDVPALGWSELQLGPNYWCSQKRMTGHSLWVHSHISGGAQWICESVKNEAFPQKAKRCNWQRPVNLILK